MAELVDALASGASVLRDVEVQVLSRVPNKVALDGASFIYGIAVCYHEAMDYRKELDTAIGIATAAGDVMRRYMYADQGRVTKSDGTPVTIADTEVNNLVIDELSKRFPDDGVIGEERSTAQYGMGRRWICDPIDGTKAFTWGVPTAMFSLALVVDGVPVMGICYEPMLGRMYTAIKGEGAYLNGVRIHVNDQTLGTGILAIASGTDDIRNNPTINNILNAGITTAVFSGAVYKSLGVADGRFVGYTEHKVNAYDIAAIEVIVTEAGGKVTSLSGDTNDYSRPLKGVTVSNGIIHSELLALTEQAT